jgi:hypothetical protein
MNTIEEGVGASQLRPRDRSPRGKGRFERARVALLGTLRSDGSPRIGPVERTPAATPQSGARRVGTGLPILRPEPRPLEER